MAAQPLFEETSWSASGPMIAGLAGLAMADPHAPLQRETRTIEMANRRLSVYSGHAAFALARELEHLSNRAVETNIFFNPRFLAPAIPRLDDKDIRLAVLRDEKGDGSRLRMVMPYAVERPLAGAVGPSIIRSWASVFGPNGTPLIDGDDPAGAVDAFLEMLARPHLNLPGVLVIPQIYADGPAAKFLRAGALMRDYPVYATEPVQRASLSTDIAAEDYLRQAFGSHHRRGYARLMRRLAESGHVDVTLNRDADAVFRRMEEFLSLEHGGWKGANRTSMASDRLQAAFARETVNRMAERDMARIMTLDLDGVAIASLIILIENGTAYTWKIAYDEAYSAFSPGMLLMIEATRLLIDDPNVTDADSCAVPDHPMMNRVWSGRRPMETIVIGLGADKDRLARQVRQQISFYHRSRSAARGLRERLKGWFRK
ncbi:MAG: GNAT family N-acetyltransferase [Phyllobacteriaceae bacterium]|nr:GNAT family N-acetyltransferase [Phyllobacteriaceae bacterium]